MGVPVGWRANLAVALSRGGYDLVHGFEPALPSLSYLALRSTQTIAVASFFSPERLGYPPGKAQREKLLGRIDALIASSDEVATAAGERFPGDYRIVSPGVDTSLFRPGRKSRQVVLEWRGLERPVARSVIRMLDDLPGWELTLLRTRPLSGRPYIPRRLVTRVHSRLGRDADTRAAILREAAVYVPAIDGSQRLRLEADASGAPSADPPGVETQPELAAAVVARLAEDAASGSAARHERGRSARATRPSPPTSTRSIAPWPGAAVHAATATRSPAGRGSHATCTCTHRGRTTARSRWRSCSTMPRRSASARSPSPTTTGWAGRRWRSSSCVTAA
jgi:hypothetical protein